CSGSQHRFGITKLLHYLDDFFGASESESVASLQFNRFISLCKRLGLQLNLNKIFAPRTCLPILGLEIDTVHMRIRLPDEKLTTLKALLSKFVSTRRCRVNELQSLIGSLSFACKAIKPGRAFLRRMLDTFKSAKASSHAWISLGPEFHADLAWWRLFIDQWN